MTDDATLSTPPAPDAVKRYRWHDDGMWCLEPNEVPPTAQWVKASDYDSLARQVADTKEEKEILSRMHVQMCDLAVDRYRQIEVLRERIDELKHRLKNRGLVRLEVLRALFEYATKNEQFPIDEPFNTYLREVSAALAGDQP